MRRLVVLLCVVSLIGCSRGDGEIPYFGEPADHPKSAHEEHEPEHEHEHEHSSFNPETQPKCVELTWNEVLRCKHCGFIHKLQDVQALVVVREEYWNEDGLEANWAINDRDIREEIVMGSDTLVFLPADATSFNSCVDMDMDEGDTNVWFKVYALYYDGIPRDLSWPVNPHHKNYRTSYDEEDRIHIKDHELYFNEQEMAANVQALGGTYVPGPEMYPALVEWLDQFEEETGYRVVYGEYPLRIGGTTPNYRACNKEDMSDIRPGIMVSSCFASDSPYH